jgi:hypothetical protein
MGAHPFARWVGSPSSSLDTTGGGTCFPAKVVELTPRRPFACAPSVGILPLRRPARLGWRAGHQFGAGGRMGAALGAGGMAFWKPAGIADFTCIYWPCLQRKPAKDRTRAGGCRPSPGHLIAAIWDRRGDQRLGFRPAPASQPPPDRPAVSSNTRRFHPRQRSVGADEPEDGQALPYGPARRSARSAAGESRPQGRSCSAPCVDASIVQVLAARGGRGAGAAGLDRLLTPRTGVSAITCFSPVRGLAIL